uniref:Uncharacterized protein n=1 Tax=Anguilla anguilla TaxID=7936 RepID=A0A0E9PTD5_ANGAN
MYFNICSRIQGQTTRRAARQILAAFHTVNFLCVLRKS